MTGGGATGGTNDAMVTGAGGTSARWGALCDAPVCGGLADGSLGLNPSKSSFLLSSLAISPFSMDSVSVISVGVFVRSL